MYCKNCGKEIDDKAVICVNCGVAVAPLTHTAASNVEPEKKVNVCSILGLVLSIVGGVVGICGIFIFKDFIWTSLLFYIITLAGIILSIVGTARSINLNSGVVMGIVGIAVSAVLLLISVPVCFIWFIIFCMGGYA